MNEVVELWQVPSRRSAECRILCRRRPGDDGYAGEALAVSWQVAHGVPATGVWFIGVPGPNFDVEALQLTHPHWSGCGLNPGAARYAEECVPVAPAAWQVVQPLLIPM